MTSDILGSEAVEWGGLHYKTLLSSAQTDQSVSIIDAVSPHDSGPSRHVHSDAHKCIVVLSGECDLWCNGKSRRLGVGEAAFIPRGTEHSYRVPGHQSCRHLLILVPGGFEEFYREMAARGISAEENEEFVNSVGTRFHVEFTGPPIGRKN